ncbi:MAG: hypothetical protein ACJA0S_000803 [Rickettsiales bacterium]|jgi:hypothetical protein
MLKKLKQHRISIIFWALIILTIFFLVNQITNTLDKEKKIMVLKKEDVSQNIFNKKKEKKKKELMSENHPSNKKFDQNEVLLRQQLQISDLRDDLNGLKMEISRFKTSDNLPRIVLTFVQLKSLVESKQDYDNALRDLEILSKSDFSLSEKISLLKINLEKRQKNQKELRKEFANLSSQINADKIEDKNDISWDVKLMSLISKFVTIRKVDGKPLESNIDILIIEIKNNIEKKQYDVALKNIDLIDGDYQNILVDFKNDLKLASDLQKSFDDSYLYLETLSNFR